jgi:hypothetical protein
MVIAMADGLYQPSCITAVAKPSKRTTKLSAGVLNARHVELDSVMMSERTHLHFFGHRNPPLYYAYSMICSRSRDDWVDS